MIVLGLAGGFDRIYESYFDFGADLLHDAAAVLVRDGEVVAGIEEERLNRIKHTNKIWLNAVTFCLQQAEISLQQVDKIAVYVSEDFLNESLKHIRLMKPDMSDLEDARAAYQYLFEREFDILLPRDKFEFVHHHLSHAATSYYMSGYDEALILSIDGSGDNLSVMLAEARGHEFNMLMTKPVAESLGFFYLDVIRFLGYQIFDEYKVMGLAPYGDSGKYESLFNEFYSLLDNGEYCLHKDKIVRLYEVLTPRQKDEPFNQVHKDLAATLQQALENIVMHMLRHQRKASGLKHLVVSGGVGQNSSMNGKIMQSRLFEQVFAPSFAADSGCAYGAAMYTAHRLQKQLPLRRVEHAYWGTPIAQGKQLEHQLKRWKSLVAIEKMTDVSEQVSDLIIAGGVVGWVQGRSEFGPRALGNRSIIADPRLASHKETINAMIKMRESYRPFAPSILEEYLNDFFEVPGDEKNFPFMSFVLQVQKDKRAELGAITHVDGSARLQTVSKSCNPPYWHLINCFREKTGVPILLNTSFNNNAEPIVDSVDDAMVCYLTSGLDFLVVGDYLIQKREWASGPLLKLTPSLPKAARLLKENCYRDYHSRSENHFIEWNYHAGGSDGSRKNLSREWFEILTRADGQKTIQQLTEELALSASEIDQVCQELQEIWSARFVFMQP